MARKVALGKGIASLIQNPTQSQDSEKQESQTSQKNDKKINEGRYMVSVSQIKINPNQPRKIFKEKELDELSKSVKENGIIQPLIVAQGVDGFDLIAGERRLRAAKKAGLEQVPVMVKRGTDRDKMIMSILENVQRSDLNCVEEALAYYQLMEEFHLTQDEVARRLGKERSSIANFLRILKLPREVIDLIQKDYLSFGHAKILVSLKEREYIIRLANKAASEKISVRELEKLSKKKLRTAKEVSSKDKFLNEKLDQFRQKLEKQTGFHFDIKSSKKGGGQIVLKYSNEAEFNDIFEYLLKN